MKSLVGGAFSRLALAKWMANEMANEVTKQKPVIRILLQTFDDEPVELGRISAAPGNTPQQIKDAVRQLLLQLAERWQS